MSVEYVSLSYLGNGPDDRRYKEEQKSKKQIEKIEVQKDEEPIVIPNEPCCGTCTRWWRPSKANGFGQCSYLVVVSKRIPGFERGQILERIAAQTVENLGFEAMRTRAAFLACRAFTDQEVDMTR